ncbi:hypothetical protein G7Y79_00034g069150 [Physcia stellaris]|nr:hypothetical protein G7Y79_00034g069150 [Physcia stellaris]
MTKRSITQRMALNTSSKTIEQHKPSFKASTTTELATQAIRHGMKWTIFRPEHGVFLAEGNGYILRPCKVEGPPTQFDPSHLSISFEIIPDPSTISQESNTVYIPSPLVDALFFGILPGYHPLHLPNYRIGTTADVYTTMTSLDPTGTATKKIRDNRHPSFAPTCLFGFSDIIPLAAPMFRQRNSTIVRVPIPAQYTVGLLTHKEGFVVFRHRLAEHLASLETPPPPMLSWVQDQYLQLMRAWPEWEDEVLANSQINNRSLEFLDACHDAWEHCSQYLEALETRYAARGHFYRDLMAAHLKNAVNWWHQAWNRMREGTARDNYGLRDYIAEGMHLYWDYLETDLIFEEMRRERGWEVEKEVVREAWVVMVFRGFCWWRCHWMMEGQDMCEAPERLGSEYYVELGDGVDGRSAKEEEYVVVAEK